MFVAGKVIIKKSCGGRFFPVGVTAKKKIFGLIMSNFLGRFFQVFMGKKRIKNIVALALKNYIKKKIEKILLFYIS